MVGAIDIWFVVKATCIGFSPGPRVALIGLGEGGRDLTGRYNFQHLHNLSVLKFYASEGYMAQKNYKCIF